MTRKRVGGGLLEHFSTPCEHCRGRGVIVTTEPLAEPAAGGERDRNGDAGVRRTRGRGRRDEPAAERPRRLPESITPAVTPDRSEAALDVGAPEPVEVTRTADEEPAGVEPATVESARDDVEEIVVEQALAAERNRHTAPPGDTPPGRPADEPAAAQPTGNGAVEAVPPAAVVNGVATVGTAGNDAPAVATTGDAPAGGDGAADGRLEPVGRAPRRRGRVTRTAGAPDVTAGDAPAVTVVTVQTPAPVEAPGTPPVAAPAAAVPDDAPPPPPPARPRRPRRTASRPAGPPAGEAGGDPV
jgi:ribonuclease E